MKKTTQEPSWGDLYRFIKARLKEDPKFLEKKIYMEMLDPKKANKHFKTIQDSEGWKYAQPAWIQTADGEIHVLTTRYPDENIETLNINY